MTDTPPGTLMKKALDMLLKSPQTVKEVSTAANLPYYWLRKFSLHEIPDPGVNRVQRLYEYLAGRTLVV